MNELVIVYWRDARGGELTGWKKLDSAACITSVDATTVGYILSRDEHVTVVAPHVIWSDDGEALFCDGEIAIPTSWIDEIYLLVGNLLLDDYTP